MSSHLLSTAEIQGIFAAEIADAGGIVSETFDDGERLFTRSLLPWVADVRPNDKLRGGVALKATEREICLHPYLFRLVCKNGAVRAHAIQTRRIDLSDMFLPEAASETLREAVRTCCVREAFLEGVEEARSATEHRVDLALELMPMLMRMNQGRADHLAMQQILFRFMGEPDRTRFGLMNAVTSLARDTQDHDLRWRLEELGGGVPVSRPAGPLSPAHFVTLLGGPADPDQIETDETFASGAAILPEWAR